jgi:hypothetical protein
MTYSKKGDVMKKLLLFIVLFVSFLYAADSTAVIPADTNNADLSKQSVPGADFVKYTLFDNTEDTGDTIASDDFVITGPFPLSRGNSSEPIFTHMNLIGTNLGAADSLAVFYQPAVTEAITDTSSRWTAMGDTIMSAFGPKNTVVDISTLSAKYIWIRFQNQTASAVVVPDYQWLCMKKNSDYTK